MTQHKLLRSKMVLAGDTSASLAKYLGRAQPTISRYLTGKADFTLKDVQKIAARYKLTPDEIVAIFFNLY